MWYSKDPANFINRWLASQARDLDAILGRQIGVSGENGGNVREEDLRRTDIFKMPWVSVQPDRGVVSRLIVLAMETGRGSRYDT